MMDKFDSTIPNVTEVDITSNQHRINAFVINLGEDKYFNDVGRSDDYKSARIFRDEQLAYDVVDVFGGRIEIVDLSYICTGLYMKDTKEDDK